MAIAGRLARPRNSGPLARQKGSKKGLFSAHFCARGGLWLITGYVSAAAVYKNARRSQRSLRSLARWAALFVHSGWPRPHSVAFPAGAKMYTEKPFFGLFGCGPESTGLARRGPMSTSLRSVLSSVSASPRQCTPSARFLRVPSLKSPIGCFAASG